MPIKSEDEVSRRTRDLYERSLGAIDRGNPKMATELLLDAIMIEPEFYQAHRLLRATQKKHFGAKGTMAYVKKAWAMIATLPQLGLGWAAFKQEKPKEAMLFAYKMLNQDPTNTQGLDLLIRSAQEMEIYEVAVLAAESAVAASPRNLQFLGTLATLYRAAGQAHKALDVYERMLELVPTDPDILRDMKDATTEVHMDDTKIEDVKSYREMIKDTKEAVNLEEEAKVVRSEERIDDLIQETKSRMEAQATNVSLVRKLADLYMQKGDFDNAQQALEKAMGQEGSDPSIEKMLGDLKIRRLGSQIKNLEAELAQKADDPALLQQLAELKGQRDEMRLEECEARVKRYPNDLTFRFELGSLFFARGKMTEALQEFQLSQRSPQHRVQSLNFMGICFRHQKMYDLAMNQFERAEKESIVMDNAKKDIIYNLAATLELMGKKKDALDQYKKIYEVDINFRDVASKIMELSKES